MRVKLRACQHPRQAQLARLVIRSIKPAFLTAAVLVPLMVLAACGGGSDDQNPRTGGAAGGRAGGPKGPVTVGFVVVQQGSVPIYTELPGRVSAYQISEVRPQANGIILRRLFKEGSVVRQGQTLYQIDASIYE